MLCGSLDGRGVWERMDPVAVHVRLKTKFFFLKKEDMVHIYNGILPDHIKNKIMQCVATWIDPEVIVLNEVKTEKDDYHTI